MSKESVRMRYRDTAKAEGSTQRPVFTFAKSDRFGDAPPSKPYKVQPIWGGAAPPGSSNGFKHHPEQSTAGQKNAFGKDPTPVEKWRNSEPDGPVASRHKTRRPNEYAYLESLGPQRYTPDRLHEIAGGGRLAPSAPKYRIDNGPPRMQLKTTDNGSADLMYTLKPSMGSQPVSRMHNASSASFGSTLETKMAARPNASALASSASDAALAKSKKGHALTREERELLRSSRRGEREDGAYTMERYMPRGAFDAALQTSKSASFSFGRSMSSVRFDTGAPSALDRAVEHAAKSPAPAPPHGGRMGVAFRADPKHKPGPGSYENDSGHAPIGSAFDGTGRLKLSTSRSSPAFTAPGKTPLEAITGRGDKAPDPGAYFQEPVYSKSKG